MLKRKRDVPRPGQAGAEATAPTITRPKPGTKSFASGKAVKDALDTNSPQAFVSFRQQIVTPYSALPLAITDPTVVILQHYLDVSPTCDEIFRAWQIGDQTKTEQQAQAAVELLSEIINILTPLPFFRSSVVGLVNKIVSTAEPYHDYLNRLCQSGRRDDVYHGYLLSAAALNVDPPSASSIVSQSSGRLGMKVWATLVEGGTVRGLGKQMGMRRRNKEGMVSYGENDPYDKPDIRHLILRLILPLLCTSAFQAHGRSLLPPIYSGLAADPSVTVYRIMTALWDAISGQSPGLNRRTSLVLFHEKSVEHLWELLSRQDVEPSTGKTVSEIVSAFLEGITTIPGKGICFSDAGWYPRKIVDENSGQDAGGEPVPTGGAVAEGGDNWKKGLHNRILGNVVRKIGYKVVDDDGLVGAWVTKVFEACPELVAGYWAHSALALEPRLNARWMATMAYVGRIISLPPPSLSTFRQPAPHGVDASTAPFREQPPTVAAMIESIMPAPLTKSHIMKGLQHTDGLVQHVTAIALARGLQKLAVVQEIFQQIEKEVGDEPSTSQENPWIRRRRELEMEVRRRIPELSIIIAFAQKAATMAPAEPETETDYALTAKSAMLTEVALRIFGLCNKALPSISAEMKFDPGRLLVSASSASAERRARREAREGSVISDSGSVASVGTMGTAGMGGGFGQSRGDVEGFEALSQLHVLELLGEVKDWNWMNKAAGSQYTYLYHILLLQLSTRQPITQLKTVSLLEHLLLPSLLFEHDPSELSIWLEALPRSSDAVSGPMLLAQQIHLLSFLDDCFRRAIKTPYRYIEDLFALVPDFFEYTRPTEIISPVILVILEQLNAKIMGQLISTEAAGIVLVYLRRVILGLVSKQREMTFLLAVVAKLEELMLKSKEAGQARIGLKDVVNEIKGDLKLVISGKRSKKAIAVVDPEAPRLRDEDEWSSRSFEKTFLSTPSERWEDSDFVAAFAKRFIESSSDAIIVRRARFILRLFGAQKGEYSSSTIKRASLSLLAQCLSSVQQDQPSTQLKLLIFEDPAVKDLFLNKAGDEFRAALTALVSHLKEGDSTDRSIGETIVLELVDAIKADKKGSNTQMTLGLLQPWSRFLTPDAAIRAVKSLIKRSDQIVAFLTPDITKIVSSLVVATFDPIYAVDHLKDIVSFKAVPAILELLGKASIDREKRNALAKLTVKKDTIRELLSSGEDAAYELVARLSASSPVAAKTVFAVLSKDTARLSDVRIIPTVEVLSDLPNESGLDVVAISMATLTAPKVKAGNVENAVRLITRSANHDVAKLNDAVKALELSDFGTSLTTLLRTLVQEDQEALRPAVAHLLDLSLQYAVRLASNVGDMSESGVSSMGALGEVIEGSEGLEIPGHLAEPVITAVIQDRLEVVEAVRLAIILAKKGELKASFIRQQLQALLATPTYARCTDSACPPAIRLNFIRLLHALFSASTYVSCQPNFIEPLLILYRGTMAEADRLILHMFQLFEGYRKLSVASILRYWSASGIVGSGNRSFDALTSLDPSKVFATCQAFPLRRPLRRYGKPESREEEGENLYDPVFVMSLLTATMCEGTITGLDWVEILRSNVLGLAICALSSRDVEVRSVASYTLARAMSLVLKTPFFERLQLLYTLRLLRHAILTSTTRLPTLTTLFFAHTVRSIANPAHFLYPLTSRFLLQRPVYDVTDTPMLYGMLYASEEGWKRERAWMLRFLKDGLRSEADWRVARRRKVWSLLATLFSSSVDPVFRRSVMQIMEQMSTIPAAVRSLVLRDSLVNWLSMQWINTTARQEQTDLRGTKPQSWERDEKASILSVVERVCAVMVPAELERLKEGKEVGGWVDHVEMFVKTVLLQDTNIVRLDTLVRIVYRLSTIPGAKAICDLLPLLVQQLEAVTTSSDTSESVETINSYLFQSGLNLSPTQLRSSEPLRKAVDEIGWRVERGDAGAEVAAWVAREKRSVEWEE